MEFVIEKIIECIIAITIVVVGRYLIPWLKSKNALSKLSLIASYADTYVKAAEKIYQDEEKCGETKYEYVAELLTNKLSELGVKVDEDTIRSTIEEAVLNL